MNNTLDGNGKPCFKGVSFDSNSTVLTFGDSTSEGLASTYNKMVTAKVEGKYVGWGDTPSFIHFKNEKENDTRIEEITYWSNRESGKFCRYHCMLLIACGGVDKKDFYSERLSEEDNEINLTRFRGSWLPISKPQEIHFKFLYDEQGIRLHELS
tara:strand:- start:97 stop:558 length:462 start_codon:yes stop_codon:yes gene_type:complete